MGDRTRGSEVTKKLAQFVHDLRLNDASPHLVDHTLRVVRDTLGTMLAGAALPES